MAGSYATAMAIPDFYGQRRGLVRRLHRRWLRGRVLCAALPMLRADRDRRWDGAAIEGHGFDRREAIAEMVIVPRADC